MRSICAVKNCPYRNGRKAKFYIINKLVKQLNISYEAVESLGIITSKVTKSCKICEQHLKALSFLSENKENIQPFPLTFAVENEYVRPTLMMNILEKDLQNVLSPLLEYTQIKNIENSKCVSGVNNNNNLQRHHDTVLEALQTHHSLLGDNKSIMIADASRENCTDEINMAAASTSDAKISTDGPSQKESEEDVENETILGIVQAPKATEEDDEGGLDLNPEEPPPSNPPSTPPTNGDIHRETIESVSKDEGNNNDGHVSSGDESPKLVINEICDKKETTTTTTRNVLKNDAIAPIPIEPIPSVPQEKNSENPSPKSPLKRSATEDPETVESVPKRPRLRDDLDSTNHLSIAQLDSSMAQIRTEIENIGAEINRKEEEWNSLIRIQKRKEELLAILERRRAIWTIKHEDRDSSSSSRNSALDEREENLAALASHNLYNSQLPLLMMKHMLGENFMNQIPQQASSRPPSRHRDSSSLNGPKAPPSPNNISIIDIHTNNSRSNSLSDVPQVSISPEAHSKLGRHLNHMMSMKPILPKPINNVGPVPNHVGNPPPSYQSGMGPQGPTVSINHIIAAHRRENPVVPPISETSVLSRGAKRGAWRHKYEGEKRGSPREPDRPSSVSSSNNETDLRLNSSLNHKAHMSNVNNSLTMNDPTVSYKDVLMQFAQLTQQTEKSPGSPQISIIPVSSSDTPSRKFEHTPDSTSVSRELSIPSQASNQSPSLDGSSALAKLLLESGAGNHGNGAKNSAVDLSSYGSSPDSLTLSALLSGGTITTHKEKPSSGSQMESRPKKNPPTDETGSNPKCQGCHKQRAQFVCAGCSNQWYCSRSCQVTAWEHHSQHCNS